MARVQHRRRWLALLAIVVVLLLVADVAAAEGSNWRTASRHPATRPLPEHWPHGHWHHGYYGGHIGWWWVVGPTWYLYDAPIYPYWDREPVDVVVEQQPTPSGPPPAAYWYWCEGAKAYYPYVAECPEGWTAVAATPPRPTKEGSK